MAGMEDHNIVWLKEPRLEDEDECGLKACFLIERVVEAWCTEAAAYEGTGQR